MTTPSEHLLLLSGAGLPDWIWDDFRRDLPANTVTVVAARPDANNDPGLAEYATCALADAPWPEFTIVAHSLGAAVGVAITSIAPHRVRGLLVVCGVVPAPGTSFISSMPFPNRLVLSLAMRLAGTRPSNKAIERSLGPGLDRATIDRLLDDFTPESQAVFREHLGAYTLPARRGYIETTSDKELPGQLQARFREQLQPTWTTELDTGHLPMIENPTAFRAVVDAFLRAPTQR